MTFQFATDSLAGRAVLLIGTGPAAGAMLRQLTQRGARVRWFSHDVDVAEEIWLEGKPAQIEIAFRELSAADLDQADALVACVGEPLAHKLSHVARERGCPVHVAGRPDLSTFLLNAPHHAAQTRPLVERVQEWVSLCLASTTILARLSLPRAFGS